MASNDLTFETALNTDLETSVLTILLDSIPTTVYTYQNATVSYPAETATVDNPEEHLEQSRTFQKQWIDRITSQFQPNIDTLRSYVRRIEKDKGAGTIFAEYSIEGNLVFGVLWDKKKTYETTAHPAHTLLWS